MNFWDVAQLEDLLPGEWESLCTGCGKCCVIKIKDDVTGEVFHTDLACHLLDRETIRCTDYANRKQRVPNCVTLSPQFVRDCDWLPDSCAYSTLARGEKLEWWHPLVSGSADTVHSAGVSVRGKISGASINDA